MATPPYHVRLARHAADLDADGHDTTVGIPPSIVDAKGDLIVGTAADTVARRAVGSNGQVLTADSSETTGVKWATPSGGGGGGGDLALLRERSLIRSECFLTAATNILEGGIVASGSGTNSGTNAASVEGHPGVLIHSLGTTTTGREALHQNIAGAVNSPFFLGGGVACRFGIVFQILTLSDATDRYTVRLGLGDVISGESVDGVFFRYVDNVNGGEWQGVARSNNTESTLDTNVAADTGWHAFEFQVAEDASSVEFFIDGTSVGTISSNIPSGAGRTVQLMPFMGLKSAGTANRQFHTDVYWYLFEFSSAR
jgi:hypothetical protein